MGLRSAAKQGFVVELILAALFVGAPSDAAEIDPMDPMFCAYPLGNAAENGRFSVLSEGEDRELAMVDASFSAATKTQLSVVSLWGTLHAVYDGRWRIGDGNGSQGGSRHNIQVKSFSTERGWNVSTEYPSNPDVKNVTPIGNSLNPRAAAYKDALWVVWARESSHNFQTNGSIITLRAKDANGTWGPDIRVTDPEWESINQNPDLLVVGDQLLVAWLSMQGATHSLDGSLKGRFFDGTSFGPVMNISEPNDLMGEGPFTLATDGTRAAAGWISQNATNPFPSYQAQFAVFDGVSWSRTVALAGENDALSYGTAVEFYGGKLYIVFDTNDFVLTGQGDYDVFMRIADPATLELTPGAPLVAASNNGDDYQAEMERYGGRLWLTWVSDDDELTYGPDLDLVVMSFDGTSWSEPRDVLYDEKWPGDAQRAEFTEHQGALVLNWIELAKPPGSTAKDQRITLRILERGPRWWDGLNATYTAAGPLVPGENISYVIEFSGADGVRVASPWYSLRTPDGTFYKPNASDSQFAVNLTYNDTNVRPFAVYACGKPIALLEAESPPPAPPQPAPGFGPGALILALAAVAAIGSGGRRALRRRLP